MSWAAFDAAVTVYAFGIAEQAVFCIAWRKDGEGACLGAESAFHMAVAVTYI